MTAENHSPPARSLRRTQCTNLWVVYNCALSNDAMLRDYPAQKVMHTTGPLMISRIFNTLKKRYKVTLFPYSKVTPVTKDDMGSYIYQGETASFHEKIKEAYCSHYFFGSWDTNFSFYN